MATINKNDLAGKIADAADLSTADAKKALEAAVDVITKSLVDGDEVSISGFGKFTTVERSARQGKNPATGETIQIAASTAPKFSAASALKTAVKG